jgi:L,D-transpeptidase-like protein
MRIARPSVAVALIIVAGLLGVAFSRGYGRSLWHPYYREVAGTRTVAAVLAGVGPRRRPTLERAAREKGIAYPPTALTLVAYKEEAVLEVWAKTPSGWAPYRTYPVLAASGGPGPKLREGDRQVPEGIYRLTHLNPASSYYLSIRVDYPNDFDRARAAEDARQSLGGDIYIHGKAVSIGCLAIGDDNIEELFTLVADTGLANARIILAPARTPIVPPGAPPWTADLYRAIAGEIAALPG